ncbi:hypothetical protein ACLOJK_010111 [Asimina triloba]
MEASNHERVIDEFEAMTKDAGRVQVETLGRILEENSSAEYLQTLGLNGRTDMQSFKSCVPLATHKDFDPYIQRIADGELSPILTGKPITTLSLREFSVGNGKALQFIYSSKQLRTKGGLLATTATTNIYRSPQFKSTMKDILSQCCSPDEVILCSDFQQTLYCHLLCGLILREEVQVVSSTFAFSIVHAFRMFERIWEELCVDIRDGVLSSRVTLPLVRDAVSKLLKPNPELADAIWKKCSESSDWYGVIPELWPNAKYVLGIMTGSMEPYLAKLRHYAGGLPLMSADYGSSEGWVGVNIKPRLPPELVTFVVLPDIAYFEFIPLPEKIENRMLENSVSTLNYTESEPVGLTDVAPGVEYEIVMTTFAALAWVSAADTIVGTMEGSRLERLPESPSGLFFLSVGVHTEILGTLKMRSKLLHNSQLTAIWRATTGRIGLVVVDIIKREVGQGKINNSSSYRPSLFETGLLSLRVLRSVSLTYSPDSHKNPPSLAMESCGLTLVDEIGFVVLFYFNQGRIGKRDRQGLVKTQHGNDTTQNSRTDKAKLAVLSFVPAKLPNDDIKSQGRVGRPPAHMIRVNGHRRGGKIFSSLEVGNEYLDGTRFTKLIVAPTTSQQICSSLLRGGPRAVSTSWWARRSSHVIQVGRATIILAGAVGRNCLYRYRLGDVVKVMGFHNSTPELQFVCRRGLILTINIDKNTEKDLQLAVEAARKVLAEEKVEVIDFTSHADTSTDPGHYAVFWELSGQASEEALNECCACLDGAFKDAGYISARKVKAIGALELRVVREGTFRKVMEHYLAMGTAVNQFKTPRCVISSNTAVLHILSTNVLNTYFSTAFD